MRRKFIAYLILCMLSGQIPTCYAQDQVIDPAPYVLSQSINTIPIDKALAIQAIRQARDVKESAESNSDIDQQIQSITTEIKQVQTEFDQYNQLIADYEGQGEGSLSNLTEQLNQAIETVYYQLVNEDADFLLLSETEQANVIESHEWVMTAQAAYDECLVTYHQAIAQREALSGQYDQLHYDLDNLYQQQAKDHDTKLILNQSLLYPYSVPYFPLDQLMLNQNEPQLATYLLNLDQVLNQLVPSAYYQLTFEDIMKAFMMSHHSPEQVEQALIGKQAFQLDQTGKDYYTYARELNLFDVEVYANFALKTYYMTQEDTDLKDAYLTLLTIKDQQCQYFYQINQEAFDQIKALISQYLNQGAYTSASDQASVQALLDKYQIQLVSFNPNHQIWEPLAEQASGLFGHYEQIDIFQQSNEEMSTSQVTSEVSSTQVNEEDKLSQLKQKLAKTQPQITQGKKELNSKVKDKETNDKNISSARLPTTGEQRRWWWVALGLGIAGLTLLGINLYQRYQIKQKCNKIKLD